MTKVEPVKDGGKVYDKRGIPIERGDIVKVFHFVGPRRKREYMYKQCLGVAKYPKGKNEYVFFSHLTFDDTIGGKDGPYHEWFGDRLMDYEIVQSIRCDHEGRPRKGKTP